MDLFLFRSYRVSLQARHTRAWGWCVESSQVQIPSYNFEKKCDFLRVTHNMVAWSTELQIHMKCKNVSRKYTKAINIQPQCTLDSTLSCDLIRKAVSGALKTVPSASRWRKICSKKCPIAAEQYFLWHVTLLHITVTCAQTKQDTSVLYLDESDTRCTCSWQERKHRKFYRQR